MAHYICPVCRSPRKVHLQDKLPAMTHARIVVSLGMLIGSLLVGGAGPWAFKLSLLYFPVWGVLEFAHWVEQKAQTKCGTCDFDPFLYQKDWRAARVAVELKLNGIKSEILAKHAPKAPEVAVDSAQ